MYEFLVAFPFLGAEVICIITYIHPNNVYIQMLMCMCLYTYACVHCVYIYIYAHNLTDTDIYINTHTHAQSLNFTHPLFSSIKIPNG